MSTMSIKPLCYTFLTLTALISCKGKHEVAEPIGLHQSYFPLKLNSRITYQVDSTVYNDFSNISTLYSFELKDTAVSAINEFGREGILINRYKRASGQAWAYQKSFSRALTDQRAEEFIDNVRYVRFTFPPAPGKTWNGNTYNNLGEQPYKFVDVDVSQTINGIALDSTASVQEINETNLIREDYSLATYAKNIGLVKREVRALDKDISSGKIKRGFKYLMQIKSSL
ncbi:MAG: hypothetical protein K0S09_1290 [Sphingobacteriaceae bacterium]|jgi:hypothetical protein|nr:hypothetical protein [Sphingobacteriaceae bacterium]